MLLLHALPVFVDTDRETFQIDARKIDAAITDRTRAIVPVHLGGSAADLDTILAAAAPRRIPVIEDACQAHLAEWKGRKVGTYGHAGCFCSRRARTSTAGEGGAIITERRGLCRGLLRVPQQQPRPTNTRRRLLVSELGTQPAADRVPGRAAARADDAGSKSSRVARDANGAYLTGLLKEIPGIAPARMYPGCTRNAYHLYMFRYDPAAFAGLSRAAFLKALRAEGVPASGGYSPLIGALPRAHALEPRLPAHLRRQQLLPRGAIARAAPRTKSSAPKRSG